LIGSPKVFINLRPKPDMKLWSVSASFLIWSNHVLSSADRTNQKPVAAFVGIDWADQQHAIVLRAATSNARLEHRSIESEPAALAEWVLEVRERFSAQGKILVCLEQSRRSADSLFDGL